MFRFILPITFIFFAASLYFSYIGPGFDKIDAVNKEIDSLNGTLSKQKKDIDKRLVELKKQMDSISSEDEEKLNRLVPQKNDFDEAGFVNDINNIASLHNVEQLDSVQFSSQLNVAADDNIESYGTFKMRFNIEGTYDEFIAFMKDIEKNEQLIDVDITSFQSTDEGIYDYGVSLITYWLN